MVATQCPPPLRNKTYRGTIRGSQDALEQIYGEVMYRHNISGSVLCTLSGDGSLGNPFTGTFTIQWTDTVILLDGPEYLDWVTSRSVPLSGFPVSSNLRQILVSRMSTGLWTEVEFDGWVSMDSTMLTGIVRVVKPMEGVNLPMGVVMR